ncbi:MAG TPA: ankyrin repeat domain-containing protein [Pyrinomonadaceae bacterium]|nr:ankyrin repeat domain-containing protein [Pyrinomonadaceae bacterium]
MKLKRSFTVLLSLAFISSVAFAQASKQELNDQFWEAVRQGDLAAVTALLDKGADVNARFRYGATALFKAAERGHTEIVKLLLARGADVTVKDTFYGATAMTWALDNDHTEIVRALLEKDSDSASDVLMNGVREGKGELVEIALAKGGLKPETLTGALAAALSDKDKTAIVEMLKKAGAQPPLEIDAATLQTYVGRYKSEQGTEFVITVKDGKLFAAPANQGPLVLMAIEKTTFRPVAFDGLTISFTVTGDRVAGFSLKQGNTNTAFKRIEEPKQ